MDFPTPDTLGVPAIGENPQQGTTNNQPEPTAAQGTSEVTPAQQALIDLDKAEKFKFEGREWSKEELRKAYLRQEDYSKKTASLAEERKAWKAEQEAEKKFVENLYYDLNAVKNDPRLVAEFLKTYPQKYHGYLKDVLGETREPQGEEKSQKAPQYDVALMSEVQQLKSYVHQQEVAKNTQQINSYMETFSKKYPEAIPELALATIYEAHNSGEAVSEEMFERAFKQSSDLMETRFKAKYSDLVKKQTAANKKGQDVDAGGGTPGKAPQKFKSLDEVTKYAVGDLTQKR
jgi:hypothetical protein